MTTYPVEDTTNDVVITRDELLAHLATNPAWAGKNVRVLEEDDASLAKNGPDGVFCYDTTTGRFDARDGRLNYGAVERHPKGYFMLVCHEEPKVTETDADGRRIVGQVVVPYDMHGNVIARENKGWNGPVLELMPHSLRTLENQDDTGAEPADVLVGYTETNPQRCRGLVAVYYREVQDAHAIAGDGQMVMSSDEFRARSTDCRSLGALARVMAHLAE